MHVCHTVDSNRPWLHIESFQECHNVLPQHVVTIGRGHRETEHDGQLGSDATGLLDGDAGILHIENGLYQQGVYSTVTQCLYLFVVCGT